jgi:catechol 2,3-dioxygenase-like lactoylglutathione lyase family enzyme
MDDPPDALSGARLITTVPVRVMSRAVAFYTEVLGLRLEASSDAGTLLRAGEGRVLLFESRAEAPGHTLGGFEVPALEPVMAALRGRGVAFEDYDLPGLRTVDQVAWIGPERAAWFRDSEGNILSVSEPWGLEGGAG